ncbi:hypothetical protein JTB14_013200 [Gonioctena quinquepunctata]|nr:hypothetical protein JTB14_013200 [Gonioctena quinquepunctata]
MNNSNTPAFDYESSENNTVSQPNMPNSTNHQTPAAAGPRSSYVSVAKSMPKLTFPKKKQAIVLHAENSLKLFDYVKAMGDIIGAKHITFASKISNNRICIYLSCPNHVDELLKTNPTVNIKNLTLSIRRLISPTKRILISNISLSIPHDLAENAIKSPNLQLASPISFLRAGIPGDEYNHINFELQTSLLVTYDGTEHRIFLSTDRMECFVCRQSGHIANNCPNQIPNPQTQNPIIQPQEIDTNTVTPALETDNNIQPPIHQVTGTKRDHPQTPTTSDVSSINDDSLVSPNLKDPMPPPIDLVIPDKKQPKERKNKNFKADNSCVTKITSLNIRKAYEKDNGTFILSVENFIAFLGNTYENNNPYHEALKFTNNIQALLSDMYVIYNALEERSTENRFTRITKKIKDQHKNEQIESGSTSSSPPKYPVMMIPCPMHLSPQCHNTHSTN